jgi:hypothetical protein
MTTLNHDDLIRLPQWDVYARVSTLNGYCPAFAETARKRGEPEAWVTFAGTALYDSRHYYEIERAKTASAVVISTNEVVEIEGRLYRATVMRGNERHPRNSDPIHFTPVAA